MRKQSHFIIFNPDNQLSDREKFRNRVKAVLLAFFFIFIYLITFNFMVAPKYGYEGFIVVRSGILLTVFLTLAAVLPVLWMNLTLIRPSTMFVWLLYVFVYVPALIVPGYCLDLPEEKIFGYFFMVISGFLLVNLGTKIPVRRILPKREAVTFKRDLVVVFAFLLLVPLVMTYGAIPKLVALEDVYSVRADFKEQINPLIAYIVNWSAVCSAILVAFGVFEKRPIVGGLGFVMQLYIYGITGFKSALFTGMLEMIILICGSNAKKFGIRWLILLVAALSTLLVVGMDPDLPMLHAMATRTYFLTGLLTQYYFEFFSYQPEAVWGHSILSGLVHYPYEADPQLIIGATYYHQSTNANANLLADGYANLRYIGVFITSILCAFMFWLTDSLTIDNDPVFSSLVLCYPAFVLTNAGLLTVLLTHGWLLALTILVFLGKYPMTRSIK